MTSATEDDLPGIAIIAMAGRFPGAADLDAFWRMLAEGRSAFRDLSDAELSAVGVAPSLLADPDYVKSDLIVPGIEAFDAEFFGLNRRDAALTDPQHRLLLECAHQALEQGGYAPGTTELRTGIYAGVGKNSYRVHHLRPRLDALAAAVGQYRLDIMNEKDFAATAPAYRLGLTGPAITVQTACSTSLTAVHLACQGLLCFDCDLALAGGVSLDLPQGRGYRYAQGGILSPDGRCRPFAADAAGTVFGGGGGVVLLKRLTDALADRDSILAVIRGSAINNDGAEKIGFTAPSIGGQAQVIIEALAAAGVSPDELSYIEAHGTGTPLGDPIEVQALTRAFRTRTERRGYCAIGSVKSNIGHGDVAGGIAGLIKTVLALGRETLPASLSAEQTNPEIDFAASPFFVNSSARPWPRDPRRPRLAGVSAFGMGGTNCHVVVGEAPAPTPRYRPDDGQAELLLLSARTPAALQQAGANLAAHLRRHPELALGDAAFTLAAGRRAFAHRRMLVCRDTTDAVARLDAAADLPTAVAGEQPPSIALLLPGQGAQFPGMAAALYRREATFHAAVDCCVEPLRSAMGLDIRQVLFDRDGAYDLSRTELTQPALFVVEYALASQWRHWGIEPTALLGHSIGEYVAACLAGVLALEDALGLVAARGRLVQSLPPGAMLAVPLGEAEARRWCSDAVSLAVVNGPRRCVLGGAPDAIDALAQDLDRQGIAARRLATSHAFHTRQLEPILDAFATRVAAVPLAPPRQPYLSNLTGDWITPAQATDPDYWVRHLREPVRFGDNLARLFAMAPDCLLECGPGSVLSTLASEHPARPPATRCVPSLPRVADAAVDDERRGLLNALGQLWLAGAPIAWGEVYSARHPGRVALPTYPFERERCWVEPAGSSAPAVAGATADWWPEWIDGVRASARSDAAERSADGSVHDDLERLSMSVMVRTLRGLGVLTDPRRWATLEQILSDAGIIDGYRQLIGDWLGLLAGAGLVHRDPNTHRFAQLDPCSDASLLEQAAALARRTSLPVYLGPERIIDLCRRLPDFLRGVREPRELLLDHWAPTDEGPPAAERHCRGLLGGGLERLVAALPATATLRVLEIGGGTGIATDALLAVLPPDRSRYLFTDIGAYFLRQAEQRFGANPTLQCRPLDLDRSPREQGLADASADIIVGVNALHVAARIDDSLAALHALLAPGGLLLLWEITAPRLSFCVYDALLMTPVADGSRSQGIPFLSAADWSAALAARGFTPIEILPAASDAPDERLIIARKGLADGAGQAFAATLPALSGPAQAAASAGDEASASATERAIIAIWRDCIGVGAIGPDSTFRALGGDSLTAVQIVARMNQSLAAGLTVNDLLSNPSIAELARVLAPGGPRTPPEQAAPGVLVRLASGQPQARPLFLVHPAGGNLFIYRALVEQMDDRRPLYGFAASGLRDAARVRRSIEALADEYLAALRSVQPSGPYQLAGASSGGLVAFAMAQQLVAMGEAPPLLMLFDTPIGGDLPEAFLDRRFVVEYFADTFSGGVELREQVPHQLAPDRQADHLYGLLREHGHLTDAMGLDDWRRLVAVFAANVEATIAYRPSRYAGHLVFFRAESRRPRYDPQYPELPWIDLAAQGATVQVVPGDHLSMFQPPHVRTLLAHITPYLHPIED